MQIALAVMIPVVMSTNLKAGLPAEEEATHATKLPALSSLLSTVPNPGQTRSVLVAHVLPTAIPFIDAVNSVYPVQSIVAVPYSADLGAVEALRGLGYKVVLPGSVKDTFVKAREVTLEALRASEQPLLVQEVGGYLAKDTAELSAFSHFRGIVEDTNNGHWRYEQNVPHDCPILSMAQSPLKDVEDTIIGDAVIYSVERVLREEFAAVMQGKRSGVIGFGKIGTSTAVALKGRETVVSVYDINPSKNMRAHVEGYFPMPLAALLARTDIIVGCTGQTSIRGVDMEHIKDGAILVSASSKNIEFDLEAFHAACQVEEVNGVTTKFTQPNGKTFYLLNRGTPINFRDKSILGPILDMIYCELFVCMREIDAGNVPASLHHSFPRLQDEVSKIWLKQHSEQFSDAEGDKVWGYPKTLELGMPK